MEAQMSKLLNHLFALPFRCAESRPAPIETILFGRESVKLFRLYNRCCREEVEEYGVKTPYSPEALQTLEKCARAGVMAALATNRARAEGVVVALRAVETYLAGVPAVTTTPSATGFGFAPEYLMKMYLLSLPEAIEVGELARRRGAKLAMIRVDEIQKEKGRIPR